VLDPIDPVFETFVRSCVDTTRDHSATLDEIAEFSVGCFQPAQWAALEVALSEALKRDDESLDKLWKHLGARIGLSPSPRSLIELAHARVEGRLTSASKQW